MRDVAPIVSNVPGSFPWHVWHDRHPALFARIRDAHPYPARHLAALEALLAETRSGPMRPLPAGAADKPAWDAWGRDHYGRPWLSAPFLWAESYFYRRLLGAVGFFDPGPWFGLDPFAFLKAAELRTPAVDEDLAAPDGRSTDVLLHAALWGNQADIGFRIGVAAAHGEVGVAEAHLVADDSATLLALLASGPDLVCWVADNAGRELLADLVLVDHLLHTGRAGRVALHVKPRPYYVSDAVTADLVDCLGRLAAGPPAAARIAARLRAAAGDGRLVVSTHRFYCAPLHFHDMPPDLADAFAAASLVVLKGDLNYRRLVGDRHWPPTMPFAEAAGYFPAPVATLRILKSDVVVGLDPATLAALDAGPDAATWRVGGRYALIQGYRL